MSFSQMNLLIKARPEWPGSFIVARSLAMFCTAILSKASLEVPLVRNQFRILKKEVIRKHCC